MGKPVATVQSLLYGNFSAEKVGVYRYILDTDGFRLCPDSSWETDTASKSVCACASIEFRQMLWQDLPGFHAAQNYFFAVYLPYGCRLPTQTLAHRLEDSRACTCQSWGFRQHARDGVLSGQACLFALAW